MKRPQTRTQKLLSLTVGLALAAMAPSSNADTLSWSGGAGTWDLNTTANWNNASGPVVWSDVTTSGSDTAVFAGTAGAVTLNTNVSALGLVFATTGYGLSGSGTLTLGTGGIDASQISTGTITIANALSLAGAQSWNVASGGALTASGVISGANALTKLGGGLLTLSAGTNTFSGGLIISAGALSVSSNTQLGGAGGTAGAISLDGGALNYTNTAALTNTHPVTITSNGGLLNIVGTGTTGQSSRVIFATGNQLLGSGALTVAGAGTLGSATGNNARFGGAGALVLSASNSYSGNITLQNGGLIEYGNNSALGSGASVTLGNEAELSIDNNITSGVNVTVTGGSNSFISFSNGGAGVLAGNVALNANLTVGLRNWYNGTPTAQSGAITGIISGAGNLTVTRDQATSGVPTLTLAADNTYTGTTTIAANSILQLGNGGTTGSILSTGSLVNNGTLAVKRSDNFTLASVLPSAIASAGLSGSGGLTLAGSGTMTLNAVNPYTGPTTVSAGALNLSGTLASAGAISVGVSGGGSAVMTIQPGASIAMNASNNIYVGTGITNTTGQGFLYQTGGSITPGTYNGLQLGAGASGSSYGYYNLSGGTANISEVDVGAFNGASTGVLDMSGGTMTVGVGGTNGWLIVNRTTGSGGIGVLNLTGGSLTFTGPAAQFKNNWGTNGTAIINIGNALLSATNANIDLNQKNSASNFGEINLLAGGTLQANSIAPTASGTKYLNFNGGTLKASNANTNFITTNNTGVNVYGNGGTIDNNGVNITIPVALLAASGSGVSTVAITNAGSGYLGAPAVTFSGGGGTGAAGYAVISSGTISSIVITNPGTGYTSAPTITLTGGGGSGATIGTINLAANTSGGMTFQGSGITTLNGASTYTGATVLNAGQITLGVNSTGTNGALGVGGTVTMNGGTVNLNGKILANNLVIPTGASAILDNATTDSSVNGNVSGSGTLTIQNSSGVNLSVHPGNGVASDWSGFTGTLNYNASAGTSKNVNIFAPTISVFDLSHATVNFSNNAGNVGSVFTTQSGQTTKLGALSGFGFLANNSTVEIGNLNTDTTFSGKISGAGAVTKLGTGTLTLSGNNTYTGVTNLTAGKINLGVAQNGTTSGPLGANGTISFAGGALQYSSANQNDYSSRFSTAAGQAYNVDTNGQNVTWATALNSSGATLAKSGLGTLTLSGTSTYGGMTTVNGGTLNVTGALSSSGTVSVGAATLAGTGVVGNVIVANNAGATVSNSGNGTLTMGSLTFNGAAGINISYSGSANLAVTGALTTTPASGLVTLSGAGSAWVPGLNNLVTFGSFGGSISDFAMGTFTGLSGRMVNNGLVLNGNNIALNITGDVPIWTGSNGGIWQQYAVQSSTSATPAWNLQSNGQATDFWTGDTVILDDTATGTTTATLHGGNITAGAITFNNSALNYTLTTDDGSGIVAGSLTKSGTGTLTITASNSYTGATTINGGTVQLGDGTTNGDISASAIANNGTLVFNRSGATFTNSNTISGTGSVIVNGSQVLTGANTYTGATTVNSGTLQIGNGTSGSIGAGAVSVSGSSALVLNLAGGSTFSNAVTNNGTVTVSSTGANTLSGAIGGAGSLLKNGSGVLTLNGANSYSGGTTLTAGTLIYANGSAFGTGTLTLNGGTLKNGGTGIGNNVAVTGATTLDLAGGNSNWTGNLSGSAALTLTNSGAASTLNLSGSNSGFSGTITFNNNNAVDFTSANAGSANAAWVFNDANAGRVRIDVGNNTLDLGSLAGNGQFVNNTAGSTSTLSVGALNTDTTFGGTIKDAAGVLALTKVGNGNLTLTGNSTYSGATNVNAGTLTVNGVMSGNGLVTVASGANLAISGTYSGGGAMTVNGAATVNGLYSGTGAMTVNGTATINGSKTGAGAVTVASGASLNGTGSVSGAVTVGGSITGSLTFNSDLTINSGATASAAAFNGNVVNNGTLTSDLTLAAGKTLSGVGTSTGMVTATAAGSVIAPGNGGVGNLSMNDLSTATGAHLSMNIIGTTAGSYSTLTVANSVTLSGGDLTLNIGSFTPGAEDIYLIVNSMGGAGTNFGTGGAFDSITFTGTGTGSLLSGSGAEGTQLMINGTTYTLTYQADFEGNALTGGNDIALVAAVPEPSTWAMIVGGLGMLVSFQRSRRRN